MKEKKKIKVKELLKSPIMVIVLAVVISTLFSIGTSYAANTYLYDSKDVSYDNTKSGIIATDVQGAVDELYACATNYSEIRSMIYPVGSIYISVTDDTVLKVKARFGGEWEAFGEGRTLVGVGTGTDMNSESKTFTINSTGGEYNHTLTVNEMPSHNHTNNITVCGYSGWTSKNPYYMGPNGFSRPNEQSQCAITSTHSTGDTGSSQPHNVIQPYITVYMWKLIA